MKREILIHYGEIALKKGNTDYFVEKLLKAIRLRLKEKVGGEFKIVRTLGRVIVSFKEDFDENKAKETLSIIPGIKSFKFVFVGPIEVKELGEEIWNNLPKFVLDSTTKPKTFKVHVKRSMTLSQKSFEVERDIGAILLEKGIDIKVKLDDPEFVVDVEFFNDKAYFSFEKFPGLGGLPPNSQGKLVSLISAGFDSPVAAYRMMRRGARVIFVHFHGYPYTGKEEMEQVKDLIKILSTYQFDTKLYMVPYAQFQRAISTNLEIPGKVRTVLYRRTMIRIAEVIARKELAKGLITGDNYGQVASQTPENIFAIHEASTIPIFQPLISLDKEDIIKISRKIGTHDISQIPCKDTCSMFAPSHPELKANIRDLQEYEQQINISEWVGKVLSEAEIIKF